MDLTSDQFKPKILIVGRENRHRSVMLETYLGEKIRRFGVVSAGLEPARKRDPRAVRVLREADYQIPGPGPRSLGQLVDEHVQLLIYVSPDIEQEAPIIATAGQTLTLDLPDPENRCDQYDDPLQPYRRLLDTIRKQVPDRVRKIVPQVDLDS